MLSRFYEKSRTLIILLGLIQLVWVTSWLISPYELEWRYVKNILGWNFMMVLAMGLIVLAAAEGVFLKYTQKLSNLVGLLTVFLSSATLLTSLRPEVQENLLQAAQNTSDLQLVSIHILRLLAIGTFIQYQKGRIPRHFLLLGSLPDFLFGVSAVFVAILAIQGPLNQNLILMWHIIGFILLIGAVMAMFLSMPSPLRLYYHKPDASILFQFPMLLAPNFIMPMFMIAHSFALLKLLSF